MQMPIPDDWNGESCCRIAVWWPDSVNWLAILHGLMEQPSQGRFWDAATGSILNVQAEFRPFYDLNFEFMEVLVACGDTGLLEIAAAIRSLGPMGGKDGNCCTVIVNGGVQGSFDDGNGGTIPWLGDEAPVSLPGSGFPEGYANEAEYLVDKCAMANQVTDGLIQSIQGLSVLSLINLIGLSSLLAAGWGFGVVILSAAAIPVIISALLILAAVEGLLLAIAAYIEDNRADFVCLFYESDSTDEILAGLTAILQGLVATLELTGPVGIAATTIILGILSSDNLNKLFQFAAGIGYPDADCSGCGEVCVFTWNFDGDEQGWTFEDNSDPGQAADYDIVEPNGIFWSTELLNEPNVTARGTFFRVGEAEWNIAPGDRLEIDFEEAPGGVIIGYQARVVLDTEEEETIGDIVSGDGTLSLAFSLTGLIDRIEFSWLNSTDGSAIGYSNEGYIREVRLYLADPEACA